MIVLVMGYSGAGKTSLVREFLSTWEHKETVRTFPDFQKGGQRAAFSVFSKERQTVVVVGYDPVAPLNRNGGDAFFFSKKRELGHWLCELDNDNDLVLFDFYAASPSLIAAIQERGKEVLAIWVNTPLEVCIERRLQRARAKQRFTDEDVEKHMHRAKAGFDKLTIPKVIYEPSRA